MKSLSFEFNDLIRNELNRFLNGELLRYPEDEVIRIDLHCHDHNSNIPDELLGRILNVPETWLPADKLVSKLWSNRMDAITIRNHYKATGRPGLSFFDNMALVFERFRVDRARRS